MFDWLGDLLEGLGEIIAEAFAELGETITSLIWDTMLGWIYQAVFNGLSEFFEEMNNFASDLFDLPWIEAFVHLFVLLGWALFVAGMVVAVFDVAVEYPNGRSSIKNLFLNILKGFFACSLIGVVPIELYKFCITLQSTFAEDIIRYFIGTQFVGQNIGRTAFEVMQSVFLGYWEMSSLFNIFMIIAFGYCIVKVFFQNLKRGGILLTQIAIGSLYMFSVPRGYTDGFVQWIKQIIALCMTAFLQTTLLYLGLLTMTDHPLLGIGVMMSANEVPRIAEHFGLDSSVKFNLTTVLHSTNTIMNVASKIKK